jgi:restriction system protein
MAVPDFQSLMLPVLRYLADGTARKSAEIRNAMSSEFKLTDTDRNELLPSGSDTRFDNNVSWALSYLTMAILTEKPSRGIFKISNRGMEALKEAPKRIDMKYLNRFPEYAEKRKRAQHSNEPTIETTIEGPQQQTPEELIGAGYLQIRDALAKDILTSVKSCSPRFFERLVVELLLKMGYGGSREDAGQVIGKSGDGGIDGVIKEDKLGLDIVYIKAKRWEGAVSAGSVRDFSGSLDYHGAKKGVFITTSSFTNDAKQYVGKTGEKKIVLLDGYELAQLMIDYNIGVSTVATYELKRIDSDYFEDE